MGSLRVQWRIIHALLLREVITRYGRHNLGFLWLFAEPMLFTIGVTVLWTATRSLHGSNLPIVAFAITGYSSVLLWRNMPSRCIGALGPNLSLLYHRNVRPIDIYLSRLVLEAAGATMSLVFLALVFYFTDWLELPENILQVIGGWLMLCWFGFALAMVLGPLSEMSEVVEKLWHPMAYFTFPLSGAAFLVDSLPVRAQQIILYLPMVHGVEYLREGWFGSQVRAHYDMVYMAGLNAGLTFVALLLVRRVSRIVIPE
jgi:ABC-type polysaccharide/polyol phosphate export permease